MADTTTKNDDGAMAKVRSAGERTISQPADPSVTTSRPPKTDIVTPSRQAGRTMTGKR